jgi:hypothetical protein
MRDLVQSFPGQIRRSPIAALAFFLLAAITAYKTSMYLVNGDLTGLVYVGITYVIGGVIVAILHDWRNGVYLFLSWLLFEDLGRKFLGNNMALYFAKDGLLLIVYLAFFIAYRRKDPRVQTFRPPFLGILLAFLWFGAMQIFNPASTHIFYGLLGVKLYFYYVPLMFIGYSLITSETELRKFFNVNLGLMLVIVALGIAQAIIGPGFLNPEVIPEDIRLLSQTYRDAPISGVRVYRPTSIFVSLGRFQDLVIIAWLLVLGFSAYLLLRHRRGRLFAFIALGVTAGACVMGASRGVFMWSLGSAFVSGAAFVWGAPWRQGGAVRIFRILQRSVLSVALAAVLLLFTYPEAFLNRLTVFSETLDPRSPVNELVHRTRDYPMRNFLAAFSYERWPYGYGIGTLSLGGQYVAKFFHTSPPVGSVESGFGAIVVEMGIVGLLLWISLGLAITASAWKVVKTLKGSPWFPLGFMIFWYAFLLLIPLTYEGLSAYQEFILNAYLWLLLGILFRLPKLALDAQFGAHATATVQPRRPWAR